ncbi:MAG: hypothetical protein A3E87_06855 [Gammaproteobacteria bacterium RIFCSPHIGHO2_12_FULL_35_23]|nr:MAG: hypothetical protein A3E87_06855 [Gammaproteobacteria bacterium RIFCSPHIGHO2_12_FULL_35_23]
MAMIDPHCHLWDLATGYYGWLSNQQSDLLGDLSQINKNHLLEDYLEEAKPCKIEGLVHIEAASTRYAKEEVSWLKKLIKISTKPIVMVAGADLMVAKVEALLDYYQSESFVKGIRQILNWHAIKKYSACDQDYLQNDIWQKQYALLEKYELSFDMQVNPMQLMAAARLARKYQKISIIINHAGMPIDNEFEIWQKGIAALALLPTVTIKISGFGMLNHHWHINSIKDFVLTIIEHFGTKRVMFASNFPVDKLYSSYFNLMSSYYTLVKDFSSAEIEQLFAKNAKRIYQL